MYFEPGEIRIKSAVGNTSVTVTHVPSLVTVVCADMGSQQENRVEAVERLRALLQRMGWKTHEDPPPPQTAAQLRAAIKRMDTEFIREARQRFDQHLVAVEELRTKLRNMEPGC